LIELLPLGYNDRMALDQLLLDLRGDRQFMANVMAWRTLPAQDARTAPIPSPLHPALHQALAARGIPELYTHQSQAVEAALAGQALAVVTPTASGKTLCYNLPILDRVLRDPNARALYLFPTKALGHDQLEELDGWRTALRGQGIPAGLLNAAAYDGDTPSSARARLRKESRLIITNPDMLHMGILPYHTQWEAFLSGLRFVVLDEMHTYRGVFGSHVANVLRRLRRICAAYGSHPQFICTSATIANPGELAERLVEAPVTVIDETGAPRGAKHIILYNPPLFDPEHGLRRSSTLEAQELAARCVLAGVQTIVFGRSRLTTELLLTYLRERVARAWAGSEVRNRREVTAGLLAPDSPIYTQIRGYRGGYLPEERRAIEAGLRVGQVRGVVATNALELGIDIGQLQAAVLCGYPGTLASTWQQMGRAGRTTEAALAMLVATGGALDQYVIRHPEFLFERTPEHALINPDNLLLLLDHLRCAAFELPFASGENFGQSPYTADVLALLAEEGDLHAQAGAYFWMGTAYPARTVNVRASSSDTVAIQAGSSAGPVVIGAVDHAGAPRLVHDGAIYLHEGQSYVVEELDLAQSLAQVRAVEVDYYTDVITETEVTELAQHDQSVQSGARAVHGDLRVSQTINGYRRVKRFTHETLGLFSLDYPPQIVETSGYWCSILPETQAALEALGEWHDSLNDYGPNWAEQRRQVRKRDDYRCTQCGAPESPARQHDVHHLTPFRTFGYVPGMNEHYLLANRLSNLVLVCRACHQRLEAGVRVRSGLDGVAYAINNLAPLYLMCDPQDIGVHVTRAEVAGMARRQRDAAASSAPDAPALSGQQLPTIYIYERAAAGLGFSARLFELHSTLINAAYDLIAHCGCPQGCPACVGPVLENEIAQLDTKRLALALLRQLTARPQPVTHSDLDVAF
jgi:DEAD/DEAH box helicase domain-containing protein